MAMISSTDTEIISVHLKLVQWHLMDAKALPTIERLISEKTGQDFGGTSEIRERLGFVPLHANPSPSQFDWANWWLKYGSHMSGRDLKSICHRSGNRHYYWM